MALTPDQTAIVARLRASIAEDFGSTISDDDLYALHVSLGSSDDATLAVVWDRTAVLYAGLVDVKEGSSSRSFANLYTRALELADRYRARAQAATGTDSGRHARTRAIVRP